MVESIVAIVCLLVVLPGMVLWFLDRRRRSDDSPGPAAPPPAELAQRAERMEQRITALEKLLDAEAPGWRTRDVE